MTYTIPQTAEQLGKSVSWIRYLIDTGRLQAEKVIDAEGIFSKRRGAMIWIISQDAIDTYRGAAKEQSQ